MSANFEKFLFLAVMLGIALLGAGSYGRNESGAAGLPRRTALVSEAAPASAPESERGPSAGLPASVVSTPGPEVFRRVNQDMPLNFSSRSGLLADLGSGQVYYDLNSDKRWPTASITKLMTASVAKSIDPAKQITLVSRDFIMAGGDVANGLHLNERYSAEDLVRAMLTVSSNEAAEALANDYGRSEFLDRMNKLAQEWGMLSTHFSDPTGLSAANQSTARDLMLAARRIYAEDPEFLAVTRAPRMAVRESVSSETRTLENINSFAGAPDFIGGKTGYTEQAGGNLLSIFRYQDRPILVIVLGADDRFGETRILYDWFKKSFTSKN